MAIMMVERVAKATQFVSATDGIDCSIFFHLSDFKDYVAIAMRLIVAQFFLFLMEVCWLLYCVVYSQCKKHTAGEEGQPEMYFCDGQNFRAKFRPSCF